MKAPPCFSNPNPNPNQELYERMLSCLYEDPQYLAALLRRSDPQEADPNPNPNPNPNPITLTL